MDGLSVQARIFTLRPFASIHVTSLLLKHVAVFLNSLSCAGTRNAWDAIRLESIRAMSHVRNFLKSK